MLTFTDEAADALRVVLGTTSCPSAGVRISGAPQNGPPDAAWRFRLVVTSDFKCEDELVLAPGGIPVSIEPTIAPLLEGAVLDGVLANMGVPAFVLRRDGQIAPPL